MQFTVYHDGERKGTEQLYKYKSRAAGTGHVIIGSNNFVHRPESFGPGATTTGSPYASGTITLDDVVMWNKELSAAEVAQVKDAVPK